ncbi:MAG TPA: glycosyltransferase family 9 protein [Chitinophagales bacterium]|nr:glycosyltransferase family 9 protein [Chitinophagales bacterium]
MTTSLKKVLVIRFSSIGDIVLTTPVVRCVKQQLPNVELHYLTKKSFGPILQANPYIDKLWLLDESLDDLLDGLRNEDFDFVADLHGNLRSLAVKYHLETTAETFNKLNLRKWLLVNFKINTLPQQHIVDRYMDAVKRLGVTNDGHGLEYFIPRDDMIQYEQLPLTHLHGFVAVAFGAAHKTKSIPYEKLRELIQALNVPVVLLGGKAEREVANKIEGEFSVKVYNACGLLNVNQSASMIKMAKAVVVADTGMMHIAAAFRKPIVTVWGNTVPAFGMFPYLPGMEHRYAAMEVNVNCRPCSKLGYAKCPRGHFKCMLNHDVSRIQDLVNTVAQNR